MLSAENRSCQGIRRTGDRLLWPPGPTPRPAQTSVRAEPCIFPPPGEARLCCRPLSPSNSNHPRQHRFHRRCYPPPDFAALSARVFSRPDGILTFVSCVLHSVGQHGLLDSPSKGEEADFNGGSTSRRVTMNRIPFSGFDRSVRLRGASKKRPRLCRNCICELCG